MTTRWTGGQVTAASLPYFGTSSLEKQQRPATGAARRASTEMWRSTPHQGTGGDPAGAACKHHPTALRHRQPGADGRVAWPWSLVGTKLHEACKRTDVVPQKATES